jgi:ribosomal protein S12 methylthiotransferase
MTNFSIISLGCPKNLVDSEKVATILEQSGYTLVAENTNEDIVILNTCAFITSAVEECLDNINYLLERKAKGQIKYLVVIGCFPSRYKVKLLAAQIPEVDLWLPIKDEQKIMAALSALLRIPLPVQKNDAQLKLYEPHYAYLKISEGCSNHCTYCTIPKIRGSYESKSLEEIVKEAKHQISLGAKELILIAEDTTAWSGLPALLQELVRLDIKWLRILYAYPSKISSELIAVLKKNTQICTYLDMPIQHVSNHILKAMNRKYTKEDLLNLLKEIRKELPKIVLRTSLIIGFPGETKEDHAELMSFIEQGFFDHIGCFSYSDEQGTVAQKRKGKVGKRIIRKRVQEVMLLQKNKQVELNQKYRGKTLDFVYEGQGAGRTYRDAPDIDGQLILNNIPTGLTIGQFYQAQITNIQGYDLLGEIKS